MHRSHRSQYYTSPSLIVCIGLPQLVPLAKADGADAAPEYKVKADVDADSDWSNQAATSWPRGGWGSSSGGWGAIVRARQAAWATMRKPEH